MGNAPTPTTFTRSLAHFLSLSHYCSLSSSSSSSVSLSLSLNHHLSSSFELMLRFFNWFDQNLTVAYSCFHETGTAIFLWPHLKLPRYTWLLKSTLAIWYFMVKSCNYHDCYTNIINLLFVCISCKCTKHLRTKRLLLTWKYVLKALL